MALSSFRRHGRQQQHCLARRLSLLAPECPSASCVWTGLVRARRRASATGRIFHDERRVVRVKPVALTRLDKHGPPQNQRRTVAQAHLRNERQPLCARLACHRATIVRAPWPESAAGRGGACYVSATYTPDPRTPTTIPRAFNPSTARATVRRADPYSSANASYVGRRCPRGNSPAPMRRNRSTSISCAVWGIGTHTGCAYPRQGLLTPIALLALLALMSVLRGG